MVNSDDDNFVKLGNNQKLVDGSHGNDGTPPDFEYVPFEPGFSLGWEEASVPLPPGSYDDLNVHAQVVPRANRSSTSAVSDRAIPIEVVCDATTTTTTSTTSTTVGSSSTTSTTSGSSTTSTTVGSSSTTSTTSGGSTTTSGEVGGSSLATSTTVDIASSTLPHAGLDTRAGTLTQLLWLGLVLVIFGTLVVRVVQDREWKRLTSGPCDRS